MAYKIVGSQEADPMNGAISEDSPFGKALLGKSEGDQVVVDAPAGTHRVQAAEGGAVLSATPSTEIGVRQTWLKRRTSGKQEDLSQLLQIRRDKLKELQEAGSDPFQITKYEVTNDSADIKANFDAMEGSQVVAWPGRLMSKRGMGKVSFCDLQDKSGRIQLYARKDEMDEEEYDRFKKYDIGDIVGVKGEVFRTQRGEMSVRVRRRSPC